MTPLPEGNADPLAARDVFVFSQKKRVPGDKIFVYDEAGAPLLFVDHPPLAKLSAPTTVYTDETRATRLLTLFQSTPSLPGLPTVYLVLDANDDKLRHAAAQPRCVQRHGLARLRRAPCRCRCGRGTHLGRQKSAPSPSPCRGT
jgi:hypothetical protein